MNLRKPVSVLLLCAVVGGVLYAAHGFLKDYNVHQIISELNNISLKKEIYAVLLAAASYVFLTFYDFLGLRYLGKKLAPMYVITTSFISYAFSNSIGLSILASGSLRYRYYSYWGLSFSEITKIIFFTTVTLWVGVLSVGGLAFCFGPHVELPYGIFKYIDTGYIGVLFIGVIFIYLALLAFKKEPVAFYDKEFVLPKLRMGLMQVFVGGVDWILAGSVLYVLMPDQVQVSFTSFIAIYLIAQTVGLISHVPGGALVFEGVLLSFFPAEFVPQIIGSVLVYRVIYYILPLLAASLIIGLSEFYRNRNKLDKYYSAINSIYIKVIPNLLFLIVFLCGAYMFMKGAMPINPERYPIVREIFPLPLVESSHFMESLIGLMLVIISRGLKMRVDLAFQMTVVLLIAGTVFGIAKGAEYETAMFAVSVIAVLIPVRKLFNRKSSFFTDIMTKEWFVSIFVILSVFIWIGFFSYKHVEYSDSLWWSFTFDGNASRFLRAMMGALVLVLVFVTYKFMMPSKKVPQGIDDIAVRLDKIIPDNKASYAYLAYLSDKKYIFSESRDLFIMYGISGRSFISMGDPVGANENADTVGGLIRDFRRTAVQHGCSSAFYEISAKYIPQYIESGYKIFKIGEEARVDLGTFSLQGGHWSGTRNNIKKLEKGGCDVRMLEGEELDAMMTALKEISDQWLENKSTREKKFSLGLFDEAYLRKTKVAAVFCEGKPVAFANLWRTNDKSEMSVDLMRYSNDAPAGVMEFLFVKLMLIGQEEGYKYFNLGMAPLSGIDANQYSPLWNKVAEKIYKHGETFYNFKGLRSYKSKFRPEWEPKYIAVHGLFALPKTIANVASLISGSAAGVFIK
ncbi:MAG: bifunctional lysylphosphatidylglycerol flippase/synthetase MprF [Deferribacterales bacterium]